MGATHHQTSAKTGHGVEGLFLQVTRHLLLATQQQEEEESRAQAAPGHDADRVVVVDDVPEPEKTCCAL